MGVVVRDASVYLITNRIDGKLYVGKSNDPEARWNRKSAPFPKHFPVLPNNYKHVAHFNECVPSARLKIFARS